MEKIYFIKNGDLEFINNELLHDTTVKMILPCAEGIAAFRFSSHVDIVKKRMIII